MTKHEKIAPDASLTDFLAGLRENLDKQAARAEHQLVEAIEDARKYCGRERAREIIEREMQRD